MQIQRDQLVYLDACVNEEAEMMFRLLTRRAVNTASFGMSDFGSMCMNSELDLR